MHEPEQDESTGHVEISRVQILSNCFLERVFLIILLDYVWSMEEELKLFKKLKITDILIDTILLIEKRKKRYSVEHEILF